MAGPAAAAAGLALAATLLLPGRAVGTPLDALAQETAAVETRLAQVEATYAGPDETAAERARRQFTEGEIRFLLGEWLNASVLMYGALDEAAFRASPEAPRALRELGDALRSQGAWGAALAAYEELLHRGTAEQAIPALTGALDCRIRLRRLDGIQPLLDAARASAGERPPAELAYLVGKATWWRTDLAPAERLAQGLAAFGAVGPPLHLAAAYFQGALLVEAGQLPAAAGRFEACLGLVGDAPDQVEIRELCALGAGRVLAEQGKFAASLDAYQRIPHTSPRFDEALYEVAWGYIRAGRHDLALSTASIIVDLAPGSRLAPEATILTGHLQLRLGQHLPASEAFQAVIATFAPVRDEVDAILTTPRDPVRHFDELITRQGPSFDVTSVLPPIAASWATAQQEVGGALALVAGLDGARQDLADAQRILGRIEAALRRSGGLDAAPQARDGWINADAVENGALRLRGQLADRAAELVAPRLAPAGRDELERVRAERRELQARLDALPWTSEEVEARAARMRARVGQGERGAFLLARQADAAAAAVAGAEAWLLRHRAEPLDDPAALAELGAELKAHRAVVTGYLEELRTLRDQLDELRDAAIGTAQAAGDDGLRGEYLALLERELALQAPGRAGLPPAEGEALRQGEALAERLDRVDAGAERLKARFAVAGGRQAERLGGRLAEERADLRRQLEQEAAVARDAGDVAGRIALHAFGAVRAQLHQLVVKAEVGLLDVAWSRKRERLEGMQRLSQQKDATLQALDAELGPLLREIE